MSNARAPLVPGTTVGGYVVEQLLGRGGMADVYLARDLAESRVVALKVLPPEAAGDPSRRNRLQFEGRILQSLRHPHICSVYEVGDADGHIYLAMEYVEGRTLEEVAASGRLSVERVVEIGRQMAAALEEARRRGVVHRDLKGSNVMVMPSGAIKILDFGLAKFAPAAGQRLMNPVNPPTDAGLVFGTAEFMSPEQALGRETDHRSDLFSLGVLLYSLLTGRLPFHGQTRMELFWAIVNSHPAPLADANPAVSAALAEVVTRLLRKDRQQRYQAAQHVANDLVDAVPARRRRRTRRAAQLQWFRRLAGSMLGATIAVAMTPALQAISSLADDAIETNTLLQASVWAGVDGALELQPVIRPAVNPSAAWISNDGHVVFSTRRRHGRGGLWVSAPGQPARMIARDAEQAAVGRRGKYVYFTRRGPEAGLYRLPIDGGLEIRLVEGEIESPVVAPDASRVVFSRRLGEGFTVWSVKVDGGPAVRLSSFVASAAPLMSPDLRRMAIPDSRGVLVCRAPSCADPVHLPVTSLVAWTPDGDGLAHTGAPGSANIWVTQIRDGSIRQVTRFADEMATSVSWSPNGRRLVVTRQETLADLAWLRALQ